MVKVFLLNYEKLHLVLSLPLLFLCRLRLFLLKFVFFLFIIQIKLMSLFLKTRFFLVHVASVEGFVLFSEL